MAGPNIIARREVGQGQGQQRVGEGKDATTYMQEWLCETV